MDVNQETILDIISLLSDKGPNAECSNDLREFCILLITPPVPFHNSMVDQFKFASEVLLAQQQPANLDEFSLQKQQVAGILSGQNHQLAMTIFSEKKNLLDTLIGQLTGSTSEIAQTSARNIAQFWLDAAQDRKVCARLQTEGLPITLYNLIKEKDAKEAKRIVKDFEEPML